MEEEKDLLQLEDVARLCADKAGDTIKHSKEMLKTLVEVLKNTLTEGKSIQFNGFGTFEVFEYPEGTIRHDPYRNQKVDVSGKKLLKFRYSDNLKRQLR